MHSLNIGPDPNKLIFNSLSNFNLIHAANIDGVHIVEFFFAFSNNFIPSSYSCKEPHFLIASLYSFANLTLIGLSLHS